MSNSYRIRTKPGVDESINILIDQEFEYLEILSLKLLQSQIYTRQCSDYGVIVGRVSVNNGFGLPNAKVSVFIPLDSTDEADPVISDLYPYKTLTELNDDGYRYNLLPYKSSHSGHVPTGTFFDRTDVLIDPTLIEVYDKYYKYTTVTNSSGDYMIFGIPTGSQTIVMDVDLSDIGEFSLSPQDLIRMGVATSSQVAGTKFKASTNLRELPQLITINKTIDVSPLWGESGLCNLGITRTDFDLSGEANIDIRPTAIFMGSIISTNDNDSIKSDCTVRSNGGYLCDLSTGPGEIVAIRQTIQQDSYGRPVLESVDLDEGGQVIDDNGTWMVDVPMNLDYVVTNEFGEQVLSDDPKKGIPTKGKYRFKVKWNQSPSLSESVRRGYFLVPNVREHGWSVSTTDPLSVKDTSTQFTNYQLAMKSYSFSLDWSDYGYTGTSVSQGALIGKQMIQDAIDCKDAFYEMKYNKVYTVSQLLDKYRNGYMPDKFTGIKNILDNSCQSENNKFPTSDSNMRFDIIYILFTLMMLLFRPVLYLLILVTHIIYFLIHLLRLVIIPAAIAFYITKTVIAVGKIAGSVPYALGLILGFLADIALYAIIITLLTIFLKQLWDMKLNGISIPLLTYPDCELCDCSVGEPAGTEGSASDEMVDAGSSVTKDTKEEVPCTTIVSDNSPANSLTSNYRISQVGSNIYTVKGFKPDPNIYPGAGPFKANGDSATNNAISTTFATTQSQGESDPSVGSANLVPRQVVIGNAYYTDNFFTSSLGLAERVNLFNTKSKYFNQDATGTLNPGGGVNRIKVKFAPTANPTTEHYDNTIVILCDKNSLNSYKVGQLISFQNPALSKDINVNNAVLNQYGNNAITGTSATTTSFTINYAKPDGTGNQSVTYNNIIQTGGTDYHKFPIDIEYFQVITGMTYNQFSGKCGTDIPNSLNQRFLENYMFIGDKIADNYNIGNEPHIWNRVVEPTYSLKPITHIKDYGDLCVLILNRGVDPYSSKIEIEYDLSILFGKNIGTSSCIIRSKNYRMNIPIQGKFLNVSHSRSNFNNGGNVETDSYSSQNLYFNSFRYKPDVSKFTAFTSNLISYYSSLDNQSNFMSSCTDPTPVGVNLVSDINTTYGRRVKNSNSSNNTYGNDYTIEWSGKVLPTTNPIDEWNRYYAYSAITNSPTTTYNRGYFNNEIVEGGSMAYIKDKTMGYGIGYGREFRFPFFDWNYRYEYSPVLDSIYFSPIYHTTGNTLNYSLGLSGNQITMRSDRLPSSTAVQENCCNGFLLQKNSSFTIYNIPDDGVVGITSSVMGASTSGDVSGSGSQDATKGVTNFTNKLVNSSSCTNSVPLKCYEDDGNGNVTISSSNDCKRFNGETIFKGGCYVMITTIFGSLMKDWEMLTEWISRTSINFGACRNVWSHTFSNNWINGTLYAYSFNNDVTYNSSNKPTSNYCDDTLVLHPTNNFYYRSSPYSSSNGFIGKRRGNKDYHKGDNFYNLQTPTTIMDLGPRNNYLQEIIMSDEYDGYVVNRLNSTTYGDVTEILNLLILSRLINQDFIGKMLELLTGSNILAYFDARTKVKVDGDYSQLIAINSEFGVTPFQASNYPDSPPGQQNPVFFNGFSKPKAIIGIFYSSDTRIRDFISPKRTVINSQLPLSDVACSFNNFPVFSHTVPFYQWSIQDGDGEIFGGQDNNWDSSPIIGSSFFSYPYQSLDRLDSKSRFFRTTNQTKTEYFKGYIYAVNNIGLIDENIVNWSKNTNKPESITTGGPFYFYFGLKKGKSAYDRFTSKWVDTTTIVD
jgi:hypothetical protein